MARETAKYKLWQHEPKAPKKAEGVVIAKMRPTAAVGRSPMSALPERARGVRAVRDASAPALTRLLENGRVTRVAPGVAILSTTPTFRYDGDDEMEYDAWDGTSMATPHVAGAAALLLAKSPGLTPAQVIARLTGSSDRVAGAKKGSRAYGAGRLNCERLLR